MPGATHDKDRPDCVDAPAAVLVLDAQLVESPEEAKVAHDSGNDGALGKAAVLVEVAGVT